MYVDVCVCMCVSMYVCVCVCMYVCMYVFGSVQHFLIIILTIFISLWTLRKMTRPVYLFGFNLKSIQMSPSDNKISMTDLNCCCFVFCFFKLKG